MYITTGLNTRRSAAEIQRLCIRSIETVYMTSLVSTSSTRRVIYGYSWRSLPALKFLPKLQSRSHYRWWSSGPNLILVFVTFVDVLVQTSFLFSLRVLKFRSKPHSPYQRWSFVPNLILLLVTSAESLVQISFSFSLPVLKFWSKPHSRSLYLCVTVQQFWSWIMWTDRQTDLVSCICFNLIHVLQRAHSKDFVFCWLVILNIL
jgi:hypothetical protein